MHFCPRLLWCKLFTRFVWVDDIVWQIACRRLVSFEWIVRGRLMPFGWMMRVCRRSLVWRFPWAESVAIRFFCLSLRGPKR